MHERAKQHIHLIGIGGSGLSAIARLLLESGYTVSGSDRSLSPLAQELASAGARIFAGHKAENIQGADLVVRSSAIPDDNVEVAAAQAAGIPVLKRSDFLGKITGEHTLYAVAGTHGKTTTTAMLAWAMTELGIDPSYIIGGTAKNLGGKNAHAGQGQAFVIEADEYDRMFLGLDPDVIIVTFLEHDHPDCYPTPQEYFDAFAAFVRRLRPGGTLLVSHDNQAALELAAHAPHSAQAFTYGADPAANYTAKDIAANQQGGFDYRAYWQSVGKEPEYLASVRLQVPGEHNVRNSLAVLAALHRLYASDPLISRDDLGELMREAALALARFEGTGRRFDIQGEVNGITVIDDYAHHPTEIQATLAAARARYPERRIWAVWQPHTFSRTRALENEFARSFAHADRVIVTDIYASREKAADFPYVSAAQVVEKMGHPGAQFIASLEDTSAALLASLQPGDVLLVLSAGDADQVSANVLAGLEKRKGNYGKKNA